MVKCDAPLCAGHLAKFDNCLAEALYYLAGDSMADETTGSSDYEGHFSLFIVTEPTVGEVDGHDVAIPVGNYVLWESTTGLVHLFEHDTADAARAEFGRAQAAYDEWDVEI